MMGMINENQRSTKKEPTDARLCSGVSIAGLRNYSMAAAAPFHNSDSGRLTQFAWSPASIVRGSRHVSKWLSMIITSFQVIHLSYAELGGKGNYIFSSLYLPVSGI